jgi:hypothetical protein
MWKSLERLQDERIRLQNERIERRAATRAESFHSRQQSEALADSILDELKISRPPRRNEPSSPPLLDFDKRLKARLIGLRMEELMRYLAIHDPEMLRHARRVQGQYERPSNRMRRHLRKTIGETHWRRFLEYYSHFLNHSGKRIKIKETKAHTPMPPPPFPTLSEVLDADVTQTIFSFLDDKSVYEASKVSREFRDAFIPRQRNVTICGFKSLDSFRQMNFVGMEFFSGWNSNMVTDDFLLEIASNRISYPNLARANIEGCQNVTSKGEGEFLADLGPRIEKVVCRNGTYGW